MDFFHCNVCFVQPEPTKTLKFFLTNCGHSFCNNCVESKNNRCRVCKQECKVVQLSNDMPDNLKAFFSNAVEEVKKVIRTLTIQNNHCKMYMEQFVPHLDKKCSHLNRKLEEKEKEVELLNNKIKLLSTQIEGMKRDMIKITSRSSKTPVSQMKPFLTAPKEISCSQERISQSVFMTPATSIASQRCIPQYANRTPSTMRTPSVSDRSSLGTPQYRSQNFVMVNNPNEQSVKKRSSKVHQIRSTNYRQRDKSSSRAFMNSSRF